MTARPEPTLGVDERILAVANRWVKEPGWMEFEKNDFLSCARDLIAEFTAPAVVVSAEPVAEPFGYVNGGRSALTSPRWMSKERNQFYDTAVYLATPVGPDAVDGWQPIETAPKDGTWLLLWEQYSTAPMVGRWSVGSWSPSHEHVEAAGGWDGAVVVDNISMPITHWAPLPEPPTAALASTKPSKGAA